MCGEKTGLSSRISPCGGSPPRVRGKVATLTFFRLFSGITPACAGKSRAPDGARSAPKDHPRVCGEKCYPNNHLQGNKGSPPRVRGKVAQNKGYKIATRITPACAGKSAGAYPADIVVEDHPRVCGEKHFQLVYRKKSGGSPPRVRGKA